MFPVKVVRTGAIDNSHRALNSDMLELSNGQVVPSSVVKILSGQASASDYPGATRGLAGVSPEDEAKMHLLDKEKLPDGIYDPKTGELTDLAKEGLDYYQAFQELETARKEGKSLKPGMTSEEGYKYGLELLLADGGKKAAIGYKLANNKYTKGRPSAPTVPYNTVKLPEDDRNVIHKMVDFVTGAPVDNDLFPRAVDPFWRGGEGGIVSMVEQAVIEEQAAKVTDPEKIKLAEEWLKLAEENQLLPKEMIDESKDMHPVARQLHLQNLKRNLDNQERLEQYTGWDKFKAQIGGLPSIKTNTESLTKNNTKTEDKFRKDNAAQGKVECQIHELFTGVITVPKADAQSIAQYHKAAEQGDAICQTALGDLYAEGRGVAKDEAQAVIWYRKAAEQGDVIAQT